MQSMRKGVEVGMTKYSLYCQKGVLFKTGTHFLSIGEWVDYSSDKVILQHGMLTDAELKQIRSQTLVNVYQSACHNLVSIVEPYNTRYYERKKDKAMLQAFIGCLVKKSDDLWMGKVHVK